MSQHAKIVRIWSEWLCGIVQSAHVVRFKHGKLIINRLLLVELPVDSHVDSQGQAMWVPSFFFFTIEAVYTPNYQLHKAMAQAMAQGFEEVKPEPQATPSPATASQSSASEGSAWAGLQLSGRAGTSLGCRAEVKDKIRTCLTSNLMYPFFHFE